MLKPGKEFAFVDMIHPSNLQSDAMIPYNYSHIVAKSRKETLGINKHVKTWMLKAFILMLLFIWLEFSQLHSQFFLFYGQIGNAIKQLHIPTKRCLL